ncbi:hypothetical protein QYF61_012446 [Mycteria americana]|uniref:Uncharacterized protein n=1 Tax=Mycteria americana TaxID=33587 RepID=A0AAN7NTB7_MYCAM|nr:hypothetical protein QYF61_012446 [Mycteria americana]
MKERYPFKEDVICHPGEWTTMERGIQYLRESAILELIYGDLDNKQLSKDPDEAWCTRPLWRQLVQSVPALYANSFTILTWKDEEGPTVDEAATQLREYEESISSSLSTLPSLSEDPSVVGLLRVEEQQMSIATITVYQQQHHTNQDSLIPIHKLIH